MNAAIFSWHRQADLTFEIEVLLTAHVLLRFDDMVSSINGRCSVSCLERSRRQQKVLARQCLADIDNWIKPFDINRRPLAGLLGEAQAGRCNSEYRLREIVDFTIGQQQIAVVDRADITITGNVVKCDDIHHTRRRAHCRKVERADSATRHRCRPGCNMQRTHRGWNIVSILGNAGHMFYRRLMG